MAATIVLLILLAWLICTAAMTFFSGHALRERHVSDGPAPSQSVPSSEPHEW